MTAIHADSTDHDDVAAVRAAYDAAGGAEAAQEWLAERGVNYSDAKLIAIEDGDDFAIADAIPEWLAIPVRSVDGEILDLCLVHTDNPNSFHTVLESAPWLGAPAGARIVVHENPIAWLADECRGVVSLGLMDRQHFKDLADACTIECQTLETARDVWTWTFGEEPKALKKIQIKGDPKAIRESMAHEAAASAKRRVCDALDVSGETDLHRLHRQMDAIFLPAPANDNKPAAIIDAQTLLGMDFPPVRYVVPGYVAEGLTILGGRPKLGKSWLALDWVVAVASGGRSLGVDCEQGDSIYLALEDNQRRLQDRLHVILPRLRSLRPDLSRLALLTEAPRIGEGLIEALETWRNSVDDPRLIVIDTLAMVRPPKGRNQDSYAADYAALSPLQRYASEHRLAVVVVTHVRKMEAEDPLEMISGTNGLTGAADAIMVLNRTADGPKLYGRGRDVEEVEKALKFDAGRWSVLGDADDVKRSAERRKIMEALGNYGAKLSPKEIAEAAGMRVNNVSRLLAKMVAAGEVVRDGYGLYSNPGKSGQTGKSQSLHILGKSDQSEEEVE